MKLVGAASLSLLLSACSVLVTAHAPPDETPPETPATKDAGALLDAGRHHEAGPEVDGGSTNDDGGAPAAGDAGLPGDAGAPTGDDGGLSGGDGGLTGDDGGLTGGDGGAPAASDDAGLTGDAGALVDAGPPSPFRVLASGSAVGSASVPLDGAVLDEVGAAVIFLARERVAIVELPGDWSGPTFRSRDSGNEQVVGATRLFEDDPSSLENPLFIGVESGERFSYALVGAVGLAWPSDDGATDWNTTTTGACVGPTTAAHGLARSYAFRAVTGLTHRRPPALVVAPGRPLVQVEAGAGPSLLVQELESDVMHTATSLSCLSAAGPFVSVVQYFAVP